MELVPIGTVHSPLTERTQAPKQGDEGAPDATLVIQDDYAPGLENLQEGDEILVLTWLHQAFRDVLRVRPRDDFNRPHQGVFSTRSPDRPNPIGLHRVTILNVDGPRIRVQNLEALDGTPIIDVKPLLRTVDER